MYLRDAGTSEGYYNSHHITVSWNCKNLEMLSYTFRPHITAFTMLEKVIVRQDDVRGLLGHICASNALGKQKKSITFFLSIQTSLIWYVSI